MRKALITGATSGIGLACAHELAARGYSLILCGRREQRLTETAARLVTDHKVKVETFAFDLSSREEVEEMLKPERIRGLTVLINNAGLALGTDPMVSGKLDDWEQMIDTNIKGLLFATRLCLPVLLEQAGGHVVNIGSVAGRWLYPGGGVYCATKFAVRALTEGLRLDLLGKPVRVTNIEPGMVETEFSDVRFGDADKAKAVYRGMTPLRPEDIAETVAWCLERPAHVNIQELVIYPTDQAGVGPAYTHRRS